MRIPATVLTHLHLTFCKAKENKRIKLLVKLIDFWNVWFLLMHCTLFWFPLRDLVKHLHVIKIGKFTTTFMCQGDGKQGRGHPVILHKWRLYFASMLLGSDDCLHWMQVRGVLKEVSGLYSVHITVHLSDEKMHYRAATRRGLGREFTGARATSKQGTTTERKSDKARDWEEEVVKPHPRCEILS